MKTTLFEQVKQERLDCVMMHCRGSCQWGIALFKLDYSEQFYPNQSFARFWNPGVKTQRLIPKD
jgi:hypothetical protein